MGMCSSVEGFVILEKDYLPCMSIHDTPEKQIGQQKGGVKQTSTTACLQLADPTQLFRRTQRQQARQHISHEACLYTI